MDPLQALEYLVLGAILGAVGQLIRVVVGIKKQMDQQGSSFWSNGFNSSQLAVSLGISAAVGAIAGILGILGILSKPVDPQAMVQTMIMLVTIGYAGTDFIEGFMKTGTTPAPAVTTSADRLDFGTQTINQTSAAKALQLINSGQAPLMFNAAASDGFALAGPTSGVLLPGQPSALQVTFTPTAVGDKDGSLLITDNAAGRPHKVALHGSGIQ